MGKPKYKPTTIVIPPELREEIREATKNSKRNFSDVIIEALNDWLNNQ